MDIEHLLERDLNKLMEEVSLYKNETDLWETRAGINNSAGNLVLHLIGNLNYFIGTAIGHTNYLRDRDSEFTIKNVPRDTLMNELKKLVAMIRKTFHKISKDDMKNNFPIEMNGEILSIEEAMFFLLTHLNYHLGQVNYHRRLI